LKCSGQGRFGDDDRGGGTGMSSLVACHECDALHQSGDRPGKGDVVHCACCNASLFRFMPANSVERSLTLHLSALVLFIIANSFPFVTLKMSGREEMDVLLSGPVALFSIGSIDIALLVLLTSVLLPLLTMLGALYLLIPAHLGFLARGAGPVYRLLHRIMPWSMLGVFMLGAIVAAVKLLDLAHLEFGISLIAFIALLPVLVIAQQNFGSLLFWPHQTVEDTDNGKVPLHGVARQHGLLHCHTCSALVQQPDQGNRLFCPRCGDSLHMRKPNSITRTWALLITGMMLFIPANIFPIMTVVIFGQGEPSTILAGVIHLFDAGMWPLGLIVFIASIMVPVIKFSAILFLLLSVGRRSSWRPADRAFLYRVTETIGSWSMIDIFVIGLLTSLVNFGALASIRPDIAASFFAGTVVMTMLAAQSFDPRLIWDAMDATDAGAGEAPDSSTLERAHG